MDLRQLTYLVTIAETGTISRASEKLNISQPPLSVALQELERELGCRLFERTPRQMILTQAGRLLYDRAVSILQSVQVTKDVLLDFSGNREKRIRIGITSSIFLSDVFSALGEYLQAQRELFAEVSEANTYQLLEKLREGSIDCCVIRSPAELGVLPHERLLTGQLVAMGQERFFPDSADEIGIEALSRLPLLLTHRWVDVISRELSSRALPMHIACLSDDVRTALYLARCGTGVALIPVTGDAAELDGIRRRLITPSVLQTDILLVWREDDILPTHVRECLRFLLERFQGKATRS